MDKYLITRKKIEEYAGTETLKCIVVGQRLESDVADYPNLKKRIFRRNGQKWNLVDFENIMEPEAGSF